MDTLAPVLARADENLPAALDRLFDFLRIPSISTDPANVGDCERAAEWVAAELRGLGFETKVHPTEGHPMVLGHAGPQGGAHVLFYGHYDVQPVDPLELWDAAPFEPRLTGADGEERIVARGSSDDKGQVMTFLEACRAHIAVHGSLPARVTVLIEGEEEDGSPSLPGFLATHGAELKADAALVCDTSLWNRDTPAITISLRGLVGEEVIIRAANRDLHSGLFGGAAMNPIRVLADLLAGLRDADGRCTLPGFYDGVPETPREVRASWNRLGFDPKEFLGAVGLAEPAGEKGRTALEQLWARPTVEFNGISGGYTGDGFKTVLPGTARAKVSFRLVGTQDPDKIRNAFRDYVRARLPKDCTAEFIDHAGSRALNLPPDRPILQVARQALEAEWGRPAALIGSGASIPIVGQFQRRLGLDCLLVGFALDDDRIHSPNEKYDLRSFHKGIRSWARILDALRT